MAHVFHDREPPEPARPAGYAWLIDTFGLEVPIPPRLAGIAEAHHRVDTRDWLLLTPRHEPSNTLAGHVQFALKYEGVNLSVLKAIASEISSASLAEAVQTAPSGQYMRRFWFLTEWLTETELDLPDAPTRRGIIPVLDPELQYGLDGGDVSNRHRVRNNLPGTPHFCPLVRRTPELERLVGRRLDRILGDFVGRTHPDILSRAASFLLLSDSKASFAIESEHPTARRAVRWAQALARAGRDDLSIESLERLQKMVIGDSRFVRLGLRTEGGFVGEHDRMSGAPLPEHISARADDLISLMGGMADFEKRVLSYGMEPVVAAAILSFGFVYVHPFIDGNGRLHRWMIHHVLAKTGYAPEGMIFPISAPMLRRITEYRRVLESYSTRVLPLINWKPAPGGNVEILNETADFYRFFDATAHAVFLYSCAEDTINRDLPDEIAYLAAYDRFRSAVQDIVDMPQGTLELLHRFLRQNNGRLSERARTKEFQALTKKEVELVERIFEMSGG